MSRPLSILVLALAACGGAADDDGLDVFAASSLTDAFAEIAAAYEAEFPDVDVRLNVAGSSSLREQILGGAPADVFASADQANMAVVDTAGALGGEPVLFATNRLVIAVPAGNPAGVGELADLADPDRLVGLCAEGVPCGDAARTVLAAAGVEPSVDTDEPNVRSLAAKIADGELDAGLVYVTDLVADGDLTGIPILDSVNVDVAYPIATIAEATDPDGATRFVDFVLSPPGQDILARHGFGAP